MLAVDVYGSLVYLPESPVPDIIDGWELPQKEQKWVRKELPDYFDDVKIDKDGTIYLTPQQKAFAAKEVQRCTNGYWLYINGVPTYITGKNYFYLQWWKLEDDIYPDYRDADRRYFLFLNHWENVLWCLGIGRGKKRREGASSQACSNLIYECVFYKMSNCGLVSKEEKDSRETFLEMVAFGYLNLPAFLKPRQLNRADSVTELVFAVKAEKGDTNTKGNRSKINYRSPKENAYDRGRMSRILGDEGGKWPTDQKFSKFISKASKTLIKGAKRVGFMECPSTVNEMTKGGGDEYKKFFDGADQFKSGGKKTPNRFVTYFTPAYDNYEGFIDEYGMSVIDAPNEETYNFLVEKWVKKDPITGETISEVSEEDIKLGAKAYVYSRRVGLTGELLEEEIRQNPCTVKEMFEAANIGCTFNSYNINQRRDELGKNDVYKRNVIFFRDSETQKVKWRDINDNEKNFHWKLTWGLHPNFTSNKYAIVNGQHHPDNKEDGAISVDSYSNSQGGRKYGSKACALIGRKNDLLDPENTGKAVGMLYGRPAEKDKLHEQVLLAGEYLGYPIWYEHTADDYFGYFKDRGRLGYLGQYPKSLIDPVKMETAERHKGTPITPFSLTKQLDNGISYFENHCDKIDFIEILENALLFDPTDRTKYDILVSFLILITVLMERVYKPPPKKTPLIAVYAN